MTVNAVFTITAETQGGPAFSYSAKCRLEKLADTSVAYFDKHGENRDISVKAIGFSPNHLSVMDAESGKVSFFGVGGGESGLPYIKIGFDIIEVGIIAEKLRYKIRNNGFTLPVTGFLKRNDKKSGLMSFNLKITELE